MNKNNAFAFMDEIKEGLTEHQKSCYYAIKWLMNPGLSSRATGRTYLLAVIAIEEALSNPGTRIVLRDHFPGRDMDRYLMRTIQDILSKFPDDKLVKMFRFEREYNSIMYCEPLEPRYIKEPLKWFDF